MDYLDISKKLRKFFLFYLHLLLASFIIFYCDQKALPPEQIVNK